MADQSVQGHFLWHELWTSKAKEAIAFYSKVAGWSSKAWDEDTSYTLLTYKGVPMAGLMTTPAEGKTAAPKPMWTPFIGADDVHVTAWEAQRLGARLLNGPETTPTVGIWAVLRDPQGATFAIYKPERTPTLGQEPGVGDFSWHELATTDHKAAWDFYRELFDWKKTSSFDMGPPNGEYLMYGQGKRECGGMYTISPEQPGPAWVSYIRVPEVNSATSRIKSAGGNAMVGPMEVPGGDWITIATDPQGAMFAVHAKPVKKPAAKKKAGVKKKKAGAKKKTLKVSKRTAKSAGKTKSKPSKKSSARGKKRK